MTPNRINDLPAWFVEAETIKTGILHRLEALPDTARQISPGPKHWSPAQMVGHLIQVEELTAGQWRNAALNFPAAKPNAKSRLLVRTVGFVLRRSAVRTPTFPYLEPTGSLAFADLTVRWDAVRGRLRATLPADDMALWIIHPIFGPLSSEQTGTFLAQHLYHHVKHWNQ